MMNIDFDYLKESNHIGDSKIILNPSSNLNNNENGLLSLKQREI